MRAPRYFLAQSRTDVDLNVTWDRAAFVSGAINIDSAQLDLEARRAATAESPRPGPDAERPRNPALARVRFNDVAVRAARQITFQENFGSAELGNVNLTLAGSAAEPTLNGLAEALRGTIRFAGRDFNLDTSVATFEPAQGIFPTLNVDAATTFNQAQVTSGLRNLEFVEPAGSSFDVNLNIAGAIEPAPGEAQPFKIDLAPTLSSNALIQSDGTTRPLSEPELFSLLTLGRLELSSDFASEGGLATSLAQGAIDTAVDLLILSELQRGLGEALGLDLVEIRTTPLGALLTEEDTDFGVSLRVGGYLTEEIFASYQIGSLGDGVSLSNEVSVRYSLDPLEFNLTGKLDVFAGEDNPVPTLEFGTNYALTDLVSLETGVGLSSLQQNVRFGVNFRW